MNKMVVVFAVIALSGEVFAADPVYSNLKDESGESKITQSTGKYGDLWKNGAAANQPGVDYVALHQVRTPTADATFVGQSFTVGSADTAVVLADKQGGHTLTWNNDGLFLRNGTWQQWDNNVTAPNKSSFAGTVTVTAPKSAPFGIHPTTSAAAHTYNFGISAKFKSSSDAGAYVSWYKHANFNRMQLFVSGDTTEYYGELTARTNSVLEISGSAFAGTLIAESGSSVSLTNKCASVGSLVVYPGANVTVYLGYDSDGKLAPFTVTGSLVRQEGAPKVKLVLPADAVAKGRAEGGLTFVRSDGETELSLEDFEIVGLDGLDETDFYFTDPSVGVDGKTIGMEMQEYVLMRSKDGSGQTSLQRADNWTDDSRPHKEAAYKITYEFRTSTSSSNVDDFPGKKVLFYDSGSLTLKSAGLRSDNMVFYGSGAYAYGSPSPQRLRGNIRIMPFDGGTVFASQLTHALAIEAPISGNGMLRLMAGDTNKDTPTSLYGDNSGFSGRLQIEGTSASKYPCVAVTNAVAFGVGGREGKLDGEAIRVTTFAKLLANESLSYFDAQRCFYFSDHARVGVADGKEFEIRSRIKMDGLTKEDPGTLAMGNYSLGFGSGNSGTPDDGVNNVIAVNAGALKVTHAEAVNGARIVLADGTRIIVGADLGATGINNVKTDVPFSSADGLIRFSLDLADPGDEPSFDVPLCTVTANAAQVLRGKIAVAKPKKGYGVRVTDTTNADGNVIFVATVFRTGMAVIIR